ncbi:hypothetical protein [Streptomyces osmaniensis]|uniref:Uncharacterized protein n=1 Tax=Streptomyces osmaniensis TaxID=593134 RepID=A0ABP6V774_9ACTN|nr:hypothetical protein KJK32_16615 [Streptomyces sp. JCM17656]
MNARTEVHAALMRVGYGAPGADRLLDQVETDALAREKDTRGGSPQQGESTPEQRHPRPCEFPTVLPCTCPRPSMLPEASLIRAQHRACIASFFRAAHEGHADARAGATR